MRLFLLALSAFALVACSPRTHDIRDPQDIVLRPSDLQGDEWREMPTGRWGGLAGAQASCEGGDRAASATNDAFAKSDGFASTAITSDRYSAVGLFTLVLRLPTDREAEEAEQAFAESFRDDAWADCYAERLQQSFSTQVPVLGMLTSPAVTRPELNATAATFDLVLPTGLLYRSEMYTWQSGRFVMYVSFVGPDSVLAEMDLPEVIDILWTKSGR